MRAIRLAVRVLGFDVRRQKVRKVIINYMYVKQIAYVHTI